MTPGDLLSLGAWAVLVWWALNALWRWQMRRYDARCARLELDAWLRYETEAGRWALEQDKARGKCYPRPKESPK